MAERSNELNQFGLVLGSLEPSEVTGSGHAGSVVMYASGSGAASSLFFKVADGVQKKLGFDIDGLAAMTGTLAGTDVFAVADITAAEVDERKVTLGEYATFIAGSSNGGIDADGAKIKLDLNDLVDVGMTVADDHIAFIDADNNSTRKEKFADIVGNMAGAGIAASSGQLLIDLSEYSAVTPTNGDSLLTLDSNGTAEQRTTLADLADLYAGAGMTATNSVMNVIGGDGITANADDIAVTAAQTTITSVKNDALVVGRSTGDDHIDFSSAGSVVVKTDDTARLTVADALSTFSTNVEIKGDLYVSGSTTTIDTDNLRIEDNLIELNSGDGGATRASNANAGLYISGSALSNDVTFKVAADGGRLRASDGLDVASGKDYAVAGTAVLNATTLGSTVVASSLTSVGALNAGSITADFGNIDNGTSNITTGGKLRLDVDATAIDEAGALTLGAGQDAAIYYDGSNFIVDGATNVIMAAGGANLAVFDSDGLSIASGDSYQINNTSVLNATTLGSAVVNSSLTSLGAQAETLNMNGNLVDNASGLDLTKADAGGDVVVNFQQGGTTGYAMGIDDSDSNTWKLHSDTALADTSDVELNAAGVLTINSLTATAATLSGLTAGSDAHKPLVLGNASKVVSSDMDLSWHEDASHLKATGSVIVKAKNDSGASADGIAMFASNGTRVAAMTTGGITILQGQSKVIDFGDFAGNAQAKIANGSGASMLEMSSSAGLHFKGDGATGANNIITVDVGGDSTNTAIVVNNSKGIKAAFFRQNSDINLKKDVEKISNSTSLDKVLSLEPVSYKFKSTNMSDIGFIAQDVAKIVPEICGTDEKTGEGRSIDYSKLTTLLAGAVQQQQVQINDLKEIIAKLQK